MAADQTPSSSPVPATSRNPLYIPVAVIVVVALIVVGLGFSNLIPGFHLAGNGSPAASPPQKFAVEFMESGLGSGSSWSVVLGGATASSTNGSLSFLEPLGTYSYTVGSVRGYVATPAGGTVVVSGTRTSVALTFHPASSGSSYAVTFSETGLPTSSTWNVNLNGSAQSGSSADIVFSVPNATYTYSVGPLTGYVATPSSGTVHVAGGAANVDIVFSGEVVPKYSLTFNESGLPPATSWSVTVNGTVLSGIAASMSLSESNGSYVYSVGSVAGYTSTPTGGTAHVSGRATSIDIAFASGSSSPTNASFALNFVQTGLPSNITWSLFFGNYSLGASTQAEGSTQTVDVENGTYGWFAYTYYYNASLPAGTYYVASPSNGTVNVSGAAQSVAIDFVPIAPSSSTTTYPVNFTETGLPSGAEWWLSAGLSNGSAASGSPIQLQLSNGTWSYNATTNASGYANIGSNGGTVTVRGGPTNAVVAFVPITTLEFNITGGIGLSPWQISISQNGSPYYTAWGSIGSNFTLRVPDGAVAWNASALVFRLTPSNGSFTAAGSTVKTVISATAVSTYAVTINESGLTGGPFWVPSIWPLNGSPFAGFSDYVGGATTDTFHLPDGTYLWSVSMPSGTYTANPTSGAVVVRGGPVTVRTNFTSVPSDAMQVLFEESTYLYGIGPDIPGGASWSVAFNGASQTTTGPLLVFVAPNGTYQYTVTAPTGFRALPTGGNVTINGDPAAGGFQVIVGVDFGALLAPHWAGPLPAPPPVPAPAARWV
ncbi:MAG: hypothetical protein ACHQ16_05005 [Candidatus Lutacidiplasmatales archaeon]